jgi:hypothetical protein
MLVGTVSVWINRGDGTFENSVTYVSSGDRIRAADINGDGAVDLVVTEFSLNRIGVFLGTGRGTFAPAQTFAAGNGPNAVAAGDFNGDGAPDIAVNNDNDGTIGIALHRGAGDFAPMLTFGGAPTSSANLVVGDFNGDGLLDLVTANAQGADVRIFFGECGETH